MCTKLESDDKLPTPVPACLQAQPYDSPLLIIACNAFQTAVWKADDSTLHGTH